MKSRFRLLPGAVLLVLGAVAIAISFRVLSTFILELVVETIRDDSTQALEPFDYSWGTMHWGRMASDYSILCVGFFLIAVGQFLVLPAAIDRIRSSTTLKLPKLGMIGASILTILAAASLLLISVISKSAFGMIAMTGGVDPVNLGEDLPVRASGAFMMFVVGAQLLILVSALGAPNTASASPSRVGKILSFGACACLLLVAVLLAYTRLGPIATLADVEALRNAADPAMIARQLSLALNVILLASPLLAASGILSLVAVLTPAKPGS